MNERAGPENWPVPEGNRTKSKTVGPSPVEEIDLRQLILILWRAKLFIAFVILLGLGAAAYYVANFVPQYRAWVYVTPGGQGNSNAVMPASTSATSKLFGQLFNTNTADTSFDQFMVMLSSRAQAARLQEKYGIMQILYESSWDEDTRTWVKPTGWFFELKEAIKREINYPLWAPPDLDGVAASINDNITIETVPNGNIKLIWFEHSDVKFAKDYLTWIIYGADDLVRDNEQGVVRANFSHLKARLETTLAAEHRKVVIVLLAAQERKLMLLNSNLPYSFGIVEPVTVTESPSRPNLRTIGLVAVGGGFVVASILAFMAATLRAILQDPDSKSE